MRSGSRTWRDSTHSLASIDRGTQTGDEDSNAPESRHRSPPRKESQSVTDSPHQTQSPERETNDERRRSFDSDIGSDAEIQTATPVVSKARIVNMPKRVPPALPPRNPQRVGSPLSTEQPLTDSFEQITLNGGFDEKNDEKKEQPSITKLDTTDERLSRRTSEGGDGDEFKSIPTTPVEEKDKKMTS
jgi:hypothetical protein